MRRFRNLGIASAASLGFVLHLLRVALLIMPLGASLSGCEGPTDEELALLQSETNPYRHGGNSSINGQVTLDTPSGKMIAPVGEQVLISPVTTYTSQRFDEYVLKKNEVPKRINAQLYYSTRTDASGRFGFTGLAAGDYFLVAQVYWKPPSSSEPKSALAYARVHVGTGETVEAVVSRDVRSP